MSPNYTKPRKWIKVNSACICSTWKGLLHIVYWIKVHTIGYNMRKRYLVWIFTARETSASSAIHWNIVSNCHFPFFIADTSAFTNSDVIIFCCRAKKCFKNYIFFCLTYPWTFSGSPHLANGACPFGITGNRMCLPRHWAVWTEPGTKTWLLFRQNARQNVFNWVLCSHFHQFLQKSAIPKKIVPVGW